MNTNNNNTTMLKVVGLLPMGMAVNLSSLRVQRPKVRKPIDDGWFDYPDRRSQEEIRAFEQRRLHWLDHYRLNYNQRELIRFTFSSSDRNDIMNTPTPPSDDADYVFSI